MAIQSIAVLFAQAQQEVQIDAAEEGKKVITGMLIVGLMVWRSRSDETMVRINTLAIRRATTCALRRSVSVKAARIDPSFSRQAKSTLRKRRLNSRAASTWAR